MGRAPKRALLLPERRSVGVYGIRDCLGCGVSIGRLNGSGSIIGFCNTEREDLVGRR